MQPEPATRQRDDQQKRPFAFWYLIVTLAGVLLAQSLLSASRATELQYSEFKALLATKKVSDLVVSEETISGILSVEGLAGVLAPERVEALGRSGEKQVAFVTTRVDDAGLVSQLEASGVRFTGRVESRWMQMLLGWMLPALLFFGFLSLLMRGLSPRGGLMAVGKSTAKVYAAQSTGVTFADVAGVDEAKAELVEIVDFLKNPERYRRLGGKIPKGVLIVGAPGTGKTLLAKAVAGEAGVPFFSLTGSEFVEMFVGVGAARVRDLFSQAEAAAPSIVFIDELDALGRTRSVASIVGGHEEREQTLNQLLAEMDGFHTQKGLIIMAATNRPEILDPALLRPGRFDRKVVLDRPDVKGREQILRVHARGVPLAPSVELHVIAGRTPGFVGADLANLVNEAALRAARLGKPAVEADDFDEAIERVVAGLERKSRVISPKEKEIVACHEAGHAVVAEFRPHADRVSKVSIIPRGIAALGYTRQHPTEERYVLTRAELLDRLDVMLGGRVAEEIVFADVSTGAQDDLQRATDLARDMVARFGMSEVIGLPTFEQPRRAAYLDVPAIGQREYSEATARTIDSEVRKLLADAHDRVRQTLLERRGALESLARVLREREVVEREELIRLLSSPVAAPDGPTALLGAGATT